MPVIVPLPVKRLSWKVPISLFLITLLLANPALAATQQEVESSLICPACIDEGMLVANCPDSTAEAMRQEIAQKLASGLGKEEIIQAYITQYGKQILAAPEGTGFDLAAWVVPFAAICSGGGAIYFWMRSRVALAGSAPLPGTGRERRQGRMAPLEEKYQQRLEEEIRKRL